VESEIIVISSDPSWSGRLRAVAGSLGKKYRCVGDWRSLGEIPADGLVVVDIEAKGINEFVRRFPKSSLVLALRPGDMAAQRLSAVLTMGADGFLPKDECGERLVVRLKVMLRRRDETDTASRLVSEAAGVRLDLARRQFEIRSRTAWRPGPSLNSRELGLLRMFLQNPGQLLERGYLFESIWGRRCLRLNPETVDKHVATLRRKLGTRGSCIRTVRGQGYAWCQA
jgi:DNA-binding response OmpR family regulator